jgi:hypothetical protein
MVTSHVIPDQHPKPRYRRSDVPDGFIPICMIDEMGRGVPNIDAQSESKL